MHQQMPVFSAIEMIDLQIESPHGTMIAFVAPSVIPCMPSERLSTFTHHAQTVDSLLTVLALGSPIHRRFDNGVHEQPVARPCSTAWYGQHGMVWTRSHALLEAALTQGPSGSARLPPNASLSGSVSPKPLVNVALVSWAHCVNAPTNACLQRDKDDRSADRVSPWHNDCLCSPCIQRRGDTSRQAIESIICTGTPAEAC